MVLLVPEHSFVTSVSEIGINMFFYVWKGCGENFNQGPGKDPGERRSLSICKCGLVGCVQDWELGARPCSSPSGVCPASGLWGGLWAVSRVESSACAPRPPWFILLVSFSDILLVVSILDIVCDCHLWLLLQSWRD